jgi:hypothetical protein
VPVFNTKGSAEVSESSTSWMLSGELLLLLLVLVVLLVVVSVLSAVLAVPLALSCRQCAEKSNWEKKCRKERSMCASVGVDRSIEPL